MTEKDMLRRQQEVDERMMKLEYKVEKLKEHIIHKNKMNRCGGALVGLAVLLVCIAKYI